MIEVLYQILFALILATALAGLAYWRDALTTGGLELAWVLAVLIGICGGTPVSRSSILRHIWR